MNVNFMIRLDGTTYCRWVEMDQVPRVGDAVELGSDGWDELVESVRWNLGSGVVYVEVEGGTDVHEEGLADSLKRSGWTALWPAEVDRRGIEVSKIEWSEEAIRAATSAGPFECLSEAEQATEFRARQARALLDAVAEAQPIVALPPCSACKGDGRELHRGYYLRASCTACKGSGTERLFTAHEIEELIRYMEDDQCWGNHPIIEAVKDFLRRRESTCD